jgi:hypothetical protein
VYTLKEDGTVALSNLRGVWKLENDVLTITMKFSNPIRKFKVIHKTTLVSINHFSGIEQTLTKVE